MPGKQFQPHSQQGPFVGLIFVSSSRGVTTLPRRIGPQVSEGASWTRATGRSFNGHTALMAGMDGEITTIVGWDPESSVRAMVGSTVWGYEGMSPIPGAWGSDVGMDADPTALYFGTPVDLGKYHQFVEFINGLCGRNDFGPDSPEGVGFSYSFAPNSHMQRLEREHPSDPLNIVANCGDAAFHVIATFFYEWNMNSLVDTLRSYILQNERTMNFSQGKLMQWAQTA